MIANQKRGWKRAFTDIARAPSPRNPPQLPGLQAAIKELGDRRIIQSRGKP